MSNTLQDLGIFKPDKELPDQDLYIHRAFGDGGWLHKSLPGYVPREGQLRLAQKIDSAMQEQRHLTAEGPPGIGKSLAYSVPLAYNTRLNQVSGFIVTANIALQEQLITKDLPLLQKALPWDFDFALLKGKNNYLCLDALEHMRSEHIVSRKVHLKMYDDAEKTDQHTKISDWARETHTGDVSELPFQPGPKVWSHFSVSSDECKGTACKHFDSCWSHKARFRAINKDIVVTNYHVLFSQLHYSGPSQVANGSAFYAVLDEAHAAASIARSFFGFRITESSISRLVKGLEYEKLLRDLEFSTRNFFRELERYYKSNYRIRIRGTMSVPWDPLISNLAELSRYLSEKSKHHLGDVKQHAYFINLRDRADAMAVNLGRALECNDEYVYYIEENKGRYALCASKIDVGDHLAKSLFDKIPSVTLVSATLAVGGSFDHVMKELGIPAVQTDSFVAESPFHWQKQAALIVPEDLADPKDKEAFRKDVSLALGYIIGQAKGRTLGLFTSWDGLNSAHAFLTGKDDNGNPRCKYRVLKQGDMPRMKLIEEFKRDKSSVLLGVESFWQGVDVPGESLSCVVIDKLPFPNMSDPLYDAISAREDSFRTYSVPKMIIAMKQGFGRLIRSIDDYGVVVILDKRIHTKWGAYGSLLINSLPQVETSVDLDDVVRYTSER